MVRIFLDVVLPGERNCNYRCQSGSITTAFGYSLAYALLTHKLWFGYNNFGSGLFGIALFFASARPISTAIHLCVFIFCPSYNYWLVSPLILFFSDVCLSDSHRLKQFLAATTRIRIYFNDAIRLASQPQSRVCEMAQSLHSTYSHTHKHAYTRTNYVSIIMQRVCQRECS